MRILLLLFLASQAWGVQTWVQNGPITCHNTAGNIACAVTGVTAGNILLIGADYRLNTATAVTSITASLGTPTLAVSAIYTISSPVGSWLYCEPVTSSGTETITLTLNGTYFFGNVVIQEFAGSTCTTAGTLSATYAGTNGVNPPCGTFTPSAANTIVAATAYTNSTNSDFGAGAGYATNALMLNNGGTTRSAGLEFKIATSAVSQSPVWVEGTATAWSCAAAAFQATGGAAVPVKHRVISQ